MATNKYQQPQPNKAPLGQNGYPQTGVKTSGIIARGQQGQTKKKVSRGPMA